MPTLTCDHRLENLDSHLGGRGMLEVALHYSYEFRFDNWKSQIANDSREQSCRRDLIDYATE
jgi:hypothetical protein